MNRSRGFTLIEVMIALTLLSMMMVATIAAMRTFGNTKATIGRVTDRVDEVRVVSEFIRNSLGAAMPLAREGRIDEDGDAPEIGTYFWGSPTSVVWVSPLLGGSGLGGVFVMRLTFADGKLGLTWHPYAKSVQAYSGEETESRELLRDVEEFELGYLDSFGGEWVEEWPGLASNPVAVRLNIKARGKYWPEMVVRLSTDVSSAP